MHNCDKKEKITGTKKKTIIRCKLRIHRGKKKLLVNEILNKLFIPW